MRTGYSWEGIRQVGATLLMARAMYLSAFVVPLSILGALYQVFHLYLYLYLYMDIEEVSALSAVNICAISSVREVQQQH